MKLFSFFRYLCHESTFRLTQPNSDLMNSNTQKKSFYRLVAEVASMKITEFGNFYFFPFTKLKVELPSDDDDDGHDSRAVYSTLEQSYEKLCNDVTMEQRRGANLFTHKSINYAEDELKFLQFSSHMIIFFSCNSLLLARTLCWWLLSSSIIVIICQRVLRPVITSTMTPQIIEFFKSNSAETTLFNLELLAGWRAMAWIGIPQATISESFVPSIVLMTFLRLNRFR